MGASAGCVLVCICASVGFTPFVPTQYRVGGDSGWGSGNDNNKGRHGIAANDKLWRNDGVRWVRLRRILGLRQGKDNGCQQQSWGVIITQRGGQLCSDGRGVPSAMTTATMHERTSALAPMVATTTAIESHPLPAKRQRIVESSPELRRKSSKNSAEGEDHWRHHGDKKRTGRGWGGGEWRAMWHRLRQRGGGVQLYHALHRRPRPPRIQCPCCRQAALRCSGR